MNVPRVLGWLAASRKTLVAGIGAVLTWAGAAYVPTGHVDRAEWYALAIALATAAGVYGIANGLPPTKPTEPSDPAPTKPAAKP